MSICGPEIIGADPIRIKWQVVRGDTATLRVEFLENDETTYFDTDGWTYLASAYDPTTDIIDELEVFVSSNYVEIKAPAEITQYWGSGYGSQTAELKFDLQILLDDVTWTPVVGIISVIGDVSGGL